MTMNVTSLPSTLPAIHPEVWCLICVSFGAPVMTSSQEVVFGCLGLLKMYFLLKMGTFQPVMLVFRSVIYLVEVFISQG